MSETKTYEVEVSGIFTTFVTVEAEDEDAAHDEAKEAVGSLDGSEWDDERIYTGENIREVAA